MTHPLIDIHQHLLFGIDDGPNSYAGMQAMLDQAHADGIRLIIATPHAAPGVRPFRWEDYTRALSEANRYCAQKDYPLRVYGGSEVFYTDAAVRLLQDGSIPTMNGTRFVLVEWRSHESFQAIQSALRSLANAGFIPIIAHVERIRCLHGKPELLASLRESFDLRIQVDCDAVLNLRSPLAGWKLRRLFEARLVDYVASDAHDTHTRRIQLGEACHLLQNMYGRSAAVSLTGRNQLELFPELLKHS